MPVIRSVRITCFYVITYDVPVLRVILSSSRNSRWQGVAAGGPCSPWSSKRRLSGRELLGTLRESFPTGVWKSTHVGWAPPAGGWPALLGGVCPVGDGNLCWTACDVVLCLLRSNKPSCCDRRKAEGVFALAARDRVAGPANCRCTITGRPAAASPARTEPRPPGIMQGHLDSTVNSYRDNPHASFPAP